jgi:hypothetical protein
MRFLLAGLSLFAAMAWTGMLRVPNPLAIPPDELAVRGAAFDYVEGLALGKPDRLVRSLDPAVRWSRVGKSHRHHYRELIREASDPCSKLRASTTAMRKVVLSHLGRDSAMVRISAAWGTEDIELRRTADGWRIVRIDARPAPIRPREG